MSHLFKKFNPHLNALEELERLKIDIDIQKDGIEMPDYPINVKSGLFFKSYGDFWLDHCELEIRRKKLVSKESVMDLMEKTGEKSKLMGGDYKISADKTEVSKSVSLDELKLTVSFYDGSQIVVKYQSDSWSDVFNVSIKGDITVNREVYNILDELRGYDAYAI